MTYGGPRHDELARFLRERRDRLPRIDGANGRRRAPGLRREEVAAEAGISTTWYTWLEQGREVNASPQVLRSLARVLRLSRSEQAYLFQLARPDLDWRNRLGAQGLPSAPLLSLLDGLAPHPAYVVNRYWQVVACNHPAAVLLGDFETDDEWSGSLLARLFLDLEWRQRFVDWPEVSRSAAAQFRLATVAMTRDPVLAALVSSLEAASEAFATCWNSRDIAEPPIWRKSIRHPVAGAMSFDFATLQPGGRDSDFSVSVYTPVDASTARRFAALVAATPDSRKAVPGVFARDAGAEV
ncbi:helix-turn-helix transcriptional regulator [Mesorhizobium sp. M0179]|uniref:helix-turn-helix transcriptional regulator n=1 Tax=unclassified Mesorhizobium TaxID=325217 RepID=UPI0003CF463E|nr:helix-turn-helix transcriptional regulator [Mesorhizobium sp. LSJC265A00]ESX14240.1 transcriptional regulator [Mesorhizobium sp. LSJC265A00]